ncbi:calcium uptake protein 3, mitochondrial isoform X8 [Gambusia affinis]|uniref:calcium uptake protein 3, mitochondrial isoform X8 n=1 Tax=Gambusia affinis TaxID=33528 RepID=UPI001CDCD3E8|nr:calcium uptake protein 3, mitochondrial isoform X8 [Gambusia affinis]
MAAFRRAVVLAGKLNPWSASKSELLGVPSQNGRRARRCLTTGLCAAAGGVLALYLSNKMWSDRKRMMRRSINGLSLPSIPTVEAKEKTRPFDFEDGDVYMSSHEHRFRMFSSVEYEGQLYMTPQNFIESVTMSEPRNKRPWRSLTKQELEKILSDTPPVWRGSSKLFRNLRERGIISYTEYLFLLCILTKPHAGFKIAFNMFDADGNQMVDKREFLVLQEIFRKKNEKKGRKGDAEKSAQLSMQLYGYQVAPMSSVLKKDSQEFVARSYWDVLRRSASQVLFSDLAEGITFDEFRSFFQFLNNLEDFAIAMQMYNFASRSIGQDEFARAVYVATGLKLTRHLVNTIFKIFDVDHDDQLSYKEFIGIMKDRLHRGARGYKSVERASSFRSCLKKELASSR